MSKYTATVRWSRDSENFTDNKYSRVHQWSFDSGQVIRASASPNVVPTPYADPSAVDPEEAFLASLSSCHMLWFLSLAAKSGFIIEAYKDEATGILAENKQGKLAITSVTLHPSVRYASETPPNKKQNDHLHREASKKCFIANSVKTDVQVESTIQTGASE